MKVINASHEVYHQILFIRIFCSFHEDHTVLEADIIVRDIDKYNSGLPTLKHERTNIRMVFK